MKSDGLIILSLSECNFGFYKRLYEDRYENHMRLNLILSIFCMDNFELTNRVIDDIILSNLNRFNHEDIYIVGFLDVNMLIFQLLYRIIKI